MRLLLVFCLLFCAIAYGQQSDFQDFDFTRADSIANEHHGASLKNLPLLTHNLTAGLASDAEKFRAIYRWVCTNIENDYTSYLRTKKKRKKIKKDEAAFLSWNKGYTPKMFQRLVNDKKTACTGYAYLVKEMASLAGLDCKIINGFGRVLNANLTVESVPNHSWNAIKLANKWHLCDATWSSGTFVITNNVPTFQQEYVDGYFLTQPRHFAKNHYPLDTQWLLTPNPIAFEDFIAAPLLYKDAFQQHVFPIAPQQMQVTIKKGNRFEMEVESQENLEQGLVFFMLGGGTETTPIIPEIKKTTKGYLLSHPFNQRGSYDLHLHSKRKPIATYVVKVVK